MTDHPPRDLAWLERARDFRVRRSAIGANYWSVNGADHFDIALATLLATVATEAEARGRQEKYDECVRIAETAAEVRGREAERAANANLRDVLECLIEHITYWQDEECEPVAEDDPSAMPSCVACLAPACEFTRAKERLAAYDRRTRPTAPARREEG